MAEGFAAESLRAARERSGRTLAALAWELRVSERQLRSLEEGSHRGFYNDRHRLVVHQRYAAALGMQASDDPSGYPGEGMADPASVLPQALASGTARKPFRLSGVGADYWLAAGALGLLGVWFSVDAWQHYGKDPVADPLLAVQQWLDEPPGQVHLARQADIKGDSRGVPGTDADRAESRPSRGLSTGDPVQQPGPLARLAPGAEASFPQPFSRAAPDASPSTQPAADAKSSARPSGSGQRASPADRGQTGSTGSADPAGLPAGGSARPEVQASRAEIAAERRYAQERSTDLCEVSDQLAATAVPVSRLKTTPYVHVSSGVPQRICIRTADGRMERLQLSANESRSVFGRAPFTVVSEQPASIEIYYLGARVRHNGESRVLKVIDPDPLS